MVLVAVRHAEGVETLTGATRRHVGRAIVGGIDRGADRLHDRRRAAADRVRPLVDVVVAVDDEIDVVLIEQRRPELPDATLGAVRRAGAVAAVVEEDHDEVDNRVVAQLLQRLPEPTRLPAMAVAEVGRQLVGHVVRVEADECDVPVREGVGPRADARAVPRKVESLDVGTVAVRRVPRLHLVIAE